MEEYFGESAKKYKQPSDKFFTLFPALERMIPKAKAGQRLLDMACGTGDMYEFVKNKGYEYVGVDISPDMIEQARSKHPDASFTVGDATKLQVESLGRFDVVLCNMLFPSVSEKEDIEKIYENGVHLLVDDGLMITSSGHPCFDGYMGKKFFNREDIDTAYEGYFSSGHPYTVHRKLGENGFVFHDHHWTLSDYFQAAKKAGLYPAELDECLMEAGAPKEIFERFSAKGTPSFLLMGWRKR